MNRPRTRPPGSANAGALALLVAMLALAAGCGAPRARDAGATATVPPATGRAESAGALAAVRGFASVRGLRPTPVPVRLRIPAIGVDTGLQRLGRARDGTVEVPSGRHKWEEAGWYAGGTRPGDPGSAVLLGHVDSTAGPAVFYRLRELRPGDRVEVARADGSRARFTVERVARYPKTRFPTDDVYYPTLTPRLRLVTCGGSFDPAAGSYRANVIVFARLAG
jgi:sortase (surface protein transpeptidase)